NATAPVPAVQAGQPDPNDPNNQPPAGPQLPPRQKPVYTMRPAKWIAIGMLIGFIVYFLFTIIVFLQPIRAAFGGPGLFITCLLLGALGGWWYAKTHRPSKRADNIKKRVNAKVRYHNYVGYGKEIEDMPRRG